MTRSRSPRASSLDRDNHVGRRCLTLSKQFKRAEAAKALNPAGAEAAIGRSLGNRAVAEELADVVPETVAVLGWHEVGLQIACDLDGPLEKELF